MINKINAHLMLSLSLLTLSLSLSSPALGKAVPYTEDAYTYQASPELVAIVEQVATIIDYQAPYEVVSPKKAGIEINPNNKFISCGINTITKNAFCMINADWLLQLPVEQQQFLIARNLMRLKNGIQPVSTKVIPYMYLLLNFLLIIGLFLMLRRTIFTNQKTWVSVISAILIIGTCELLFMDNLEIKLLDHLNLQHDIENTKLAVTKTGNRNAAIQALERLNSDINLEAQTNLAFWQNQLGTLDIYIQTLKTQN